MTRMFVIGGLPAGVSFCDLRGSSGAPSRNIAPKHSWRSLSRDWKRLKSRRIFWPPIYDTLDPAFLNASLSLFVLNCNAEWCGRCRACSMLPAWGARNAAGRLQVHARPTGSRVQIINGTISIAVRVTSAVFPNPMCAAQLGLVEPMSRSMIAQRWTSVRESGRHAG